LSVEYFLRVLDAIQAMKQSKKWNKHEDDPDKTHINTKPDGHGAYKYAFQSTSHQSDFYQFCEMSSKNFPKDIFDQDSTDRPIADSGDVEIPSESEYITLIVGERTFRTSRSTLRSESGYFRAILSYRWDGRKSRLFIDADPEMFGHLLRFLRRPSKFPVFWSKNKGHDFSMYQALQQEAEFFGVDGLAEWLKEKKYLKAVIVTTEGKVEEFIHKPIQVESANVDVEYHPHMRLKKIYLCPRRIPVHEGDSAKCGRACHEAQGGAPDEYREEYSLWNLVVRKVVTFDENVIICGT
jgi:hypothetical protein